MKPHEERPTLVTERSTQGRRGARLARVGLAAYCLFVVYGSFFPFEFTTESVIVRERLRTVVFSPLDSAGRRRFSIPDVVSNLVLGVPVGLLLVRGGLAGRSVFARGTTSAVVQLAFASAVEAGQLLTPGRTASLLDVAAQGVGAVSGAVGAHVMLRLLDSATGQRARLEFRRQPALILVAILTVLLAADALYPYVVTLDVSTVSQNLRNAQLIPFQSLGRRFWGDLIVEKVIPYAALAASLRVVLRGPASGWAAVVAAGVGVGFASSLEVGKILIAGRFPNIDNVILAVSGAVIGAALAAPVIRMPEVRARAPRLLILVAGALMIYEELTPFDFVASLDAAWAKVERIEWALLASYYEADPQKAIFDLAKKLLLGAFFGAALRAAGWRGALFWGSILGAFLEALQVLQASHFPSATDAISLGLGAALGAALLGRYRASASRPHPGAARVRPRTEVLDSRAVGSAGRPRSTRHADGER